MAGGVCPPVESTTPTTVAKVIPTPIVAPSTAPTVKTVETLAAAPVASGPPETVLAHTGLAADVEVGLGVGIVAIGLLLLLITTKRRAVS